MINFRRVEHHIYWLFIAVVLISGLGWFTNTFNPDRLYLMVIFFLLIFVILFSLVMYILNNVRRGILCGLGIVIFLILRYLGLRDFYFPTFLFILLILLDLYLSKKSLPPNLK
jgi:hypothetical protein